MKNRKFRFVGLMTVLLLSGFITTSLVSYYVAHDSLSRQIAETTLPLTSDNIYSEIQRDLLQPIFISSLMAQDTFFRDWAINGEKDEAAMVRYLKEIQNQYSTITSFFVSEDTRKYYHPSGVLKRVSGTDPQDSWYFRVRRMHTDYEINVDTNTVDGHSMVIFINYRVYDYSGRYIGATGVGLAVTAVKKMIDAYQNRYGREIYFINQEGDITLHSDNYDGAENIRKVPGLAAHATHILTSPGNALTYESGGKTVFINSRLVPQFGWYLLVSQKDDPAEKRILNTLLVNLGISFVITMVVLLLVTLIIGGYQRKLEEMATTDKLTGAANRQVFDMIFEQAMKSIRRRKHPLTVIMFDIDHFKKVNDTFGHATGDVTLKEVTRTAKAHTREMDVLFRWGGEEFLILLADCDLEQGKMVAEKIRRAMADCRTVIHHGTTVSFTASFGVAQLEEEDSSADLIRRADEALYTAKESGRNRVVTTATASSSYSAA